MIEHRPPPGIASGSIAERPLPDPPGIDGARQRAAVDRSIPRGLDAGDADRTPAVSTDVWSDHVRYATSREPHVLDRLVREYQRYALSLARRLQRDGEDTDDLDQVALEALVVALTRFDPERGIPFPAFGTPTIMGAIRRHYRDRGWLVRVPRWVHEYASAQRSVVERLTGSLGRPPTTDELAQALGMDVEQCIEAQDAVHARNALSIEALTTDGTAIADHLGSADHQLARTDDRLSLRRALEGLDPDARQLIGLYFFDGLTQSEIAARLEVSQMQVSRLLANALRRLRQNMGELDDR